MSDTVDARADRTDELVTRRRRHIRWHREVIAHIERGEIRPTLALCSALIDFDAGARHMLITANEASRRARKSPYSVTGARR